MNTHLHRKFFDPFFQIPRTRTRNGNFSCFLTNSENSIFCGGVASNRCFQASQAFSSSYLVRKNIRLVKLKNWAKDLPCLKCSKGPFSRSMNAVMSLFPRIEGIMFMKCSVLLVAVCWLYLLVWFGQKKAKSFVESNIFPSVSSVLSECLRRKVELGVVRRITPLSITIDLCSVGTHYDEFSCLDIPKIKLRLRPLACFRTGKIVTDAILCSPNLLVVQKKDYTWLGIPSLKRHKRKLLSTEEGIHYRTKNRRKAREKAAAQRAEETDVAARLAAEMGYIYYDKEGCSFDFVEGMAAKNQSNYVEDQHFVGKERYGLKNTKLEKPLGDKNNNPGFNLWYMKLVHIFNTNVSYTNKSNATIASKTKMLELSAEKALSYFRENLSQYTSDTSESCKIDGSLLDTSSPNTSSSGSYQRRKNGPVTDIVNHGYDSGGRHSKYVDNGNISGIFNFIQKEDSGKITEFSEELNKETNEMIEQKNRPDICTTSNDNYDLQEQPDSLNIDVGIEGSPLSSKGQEIRHPQNFLVNQRASSPIPSTSMNPESKITAPHSIIERICKNMAPCFRRTCKSLCDITFGSTKKEKSTNVDDINNEAFNDAGGLKSDIGWQMLPVVVDSVFFKGGTVMLLAYGDREPREMGNVTGHIKFQNNYRHMNIHVSGNCKTWKSVELTRDGGWLSTDVFIDMAEQKWDVNLNLRNIFVPLFERILEIPITWFTGRTSGEIHICMSKEEEFPNLHGQLDVSSLAFQTYDSPAKFTECSASLFFRGQRIFLHSANGWFGSVPVEISGDFGIHPEGQFHLICHVPCVEVNTLMKTFKMDLPVFPLAGTLTSVFNCQGPLDAPLFVGNAMASRKHALSMPSVSESPAYDALMKNIDAGAVAALDVVPFSSVSANFTFSADDCVGDFFGIRAVLVDGGEIRGAGSAWICPEGEVDNKALDVSVSGNLSFVGLLSQYLPHCPEFLKSQFLELKAELKISGALLQPYAHNF